MFSSITRSCHEPIRNSLAFTALRLFLLVRKLRIWSLHSSNTERRCPNRGQNPCNLTKKRTADPDELKKEIPEHIFKNAICSFESQDILALVREPQEKKSDSRASSDSRVF